MELTKQPLFRSTYTSLSNQWLKSKTTVPFTTKLFYRFHRPLLQSVLFICITVKVKVQYSINFITISILERPQTN